MDKLFNAGLNALNDRDDDKKGEQLAQAPLPKAHSSAYGGFLSALGGDNDDMKDAAEEASRRAGDSGDTDLFSSVLGALGQKKDRIADEDLDEEDAVNKHRKFFGGGDDNDHQADSSGLGAAAAMQALKMFSSGETGNKQTQGAFVAMAMSEASKLFDQKASQGKVASGENKESTVEEAGKMALKMYLKSQGKDSSSSSGAGGLLSLASKYM